MSLKIIHVLLGKANPDRMNGVNKVVNSLATYQSTLGYEVSVWGITKTLELNYPTRNYETVLFLDKGKFTLDPNISDNLNRISENVIFHIHGAFIPQFHMLARKLVKHGLEYFYTPHGAYNAVAMERSAFKKKIYTTLFEKYIVKNAKKLHFIGASEATGAKKLFSELDYELIPNGQNIEELQFEYKSIKETDIPIFGFVGRLDIKTKGLDILLKGFANYLDKINDSGELWLIGDGPEKAKLVELARFLHIENSIKILGSKFGEEKLNLMANMDYLCLTSRNEGLPGVVLEAAAVGTPSIVSRETNMSQYIENSSAGFTVEENNPEKVADSLRRAASFINSGELNKLRSNAKKMVVKNFNWLGISQKLIKAYES